MPSEQESDDGFENPLSPEKRNDNPGFRGSFRVFTTEQKHYYGKVAKCY